MTKPPAAEPVNSVVAEAPPVALPVRKRARLELLDGDEIIQISVRPSPWAILLYALRPACALLLVAVAVVLASRGEPSLMASIALAVVSLGIFASIIAATLAWGSQLYVLTNRRVLSFRGVFSVAVEQCVLRNLTGAELESRWPEPLLRLGSVRLTPKDADCPPMRWEHLAHPAEVHEILERAIGRSRSGFQPQP